MKSAHGKANAIARQESFTRILYAISFGANNAQAAEYAGRRYNALASWVQRGREALAKQDDKRTPIEQECVELLTKIETLRAKTPTNKAKFATVLEEKRVRDGHVFNETNEPSIYDPRSALSPAVQKKVLHCLRLGMTRLHSAQAAGIGPSTAAAWFERGTLALRVLQNEGKDAVEESEYMYMVFAANVLVAEGEALGDWMQTLDDHAPRDWRAHAFKIERRFPSSYGKHVSEQHIKSTSTSVHLVITSDEIAQARQEALAWETETFDE